MKYGEKGINNKLNIGRPYIWRGWVLSGILWGLHRQKLHFFIFSEARDQGWGIFVSKGWAVTYDSQKISINNWNCLSISSFVLTGGAPQCSPIVSPPCPPPPCAPPPPPPSTDPLLALPSPPPVSLSVINHSKARLFPPQASLSTIWNFARKYS